MLTKKVKDVDRTRVELDTRFATKRRKVFSSVPDAKILQDGERALYTDGTDVWAIYRVGNKIYRDTDALTEVT